LNDIRINEIEHTAKSQAPETSTFGNELAAEKLKITIHQLRIKLQQN
jgi:hypothetical protein